MAEGIVSGRYRLVEQIAVSGMSEVWVAEDLELERRVALKLLGSAADRGRFDREAKAAAGLSHPNICQLYHYGDADGRPYLVLELLTGGSLEDRLGTGERIPDADTARIAGDVASALAYAHQQGVVHRDVKPTNVLFDEEERAKLVDFGIARITGVSTLTDAGTVLGTAAYISPEQATGEPVGPPADVYAFGVILYRMLTGRLPLEAEHPLELAAMHATRPPQPISALRADAPPDLERLAMHALEKRPEDRPADGRALLAALSAGADDETAILTMPARRLRRRHVAAGVGLAAAAVAGAALAILATPEASQAPVTGTQPSTSRTSQRQSTQDAGTTTTSSTTPATTRRRTTATTGSRRTSTKPATAPTTAPATTATAPATTATAPTDTATPTDTTTTPTDTTTTTPTDTTTLGTTATSP